MPKPIRYSHAAHLVLQHLAGAPARWHHGYALMADLELASGTLYPVLMRLQTAGWLETRWEAPAQNGRPPHHLYRLARGTAPEARALLREWAQRDAKHRVPKAAT